MPEEMQVELLYHLTILKAESLTLHEFMCEAWASVDPAQFVDGWHLRAICDHLTAVSECQIMNLLVNMPFRHCKSLLCAVFWPAWEWISRPQTRWLFASYAHILSIRDSLKCKRLIESHWYQTRYGHIYQPTKDQWSKSRLENDALGYRIPTSVNGTGTGEGADIICCDDPHNVRKAESEPVREGTIMWWMEAMSSRVTDPKTKRRVIFCQRAHNNDLSRACRDSGIYEYLCLPGEFNGRVYSTSIGFKDPRTVEGELLWPEQWDEKAMESIKKDLGHYAFSLQVQQEDCPRGGGIIKREWLEKNYYEPFDRPQNFDFIIQSWDTAFKKGMHNDFSACVTAGIKGNDIYVLDVFKQKIEYPVYKKTAIAMYRKFGPIMILAEDSNAAAMLMQEAKKPMEDDDDKVMVRLPMKAISPHTDKEALAHACTIHIQMHYRIPKDAPWRDDYVEELSNFPYSQHDDQAIATIQMVSFLARNRTKKHVLDYMSR
ncbi:MAG TPA: phage terminase large subunit [Cyclobacteriaceae bacterium]|nr:phage terminase large subunit [Cyclobacteriaceae bacterium]